MGDKHYLVGSLVEIVSPINLTRMECLHTYGLIIQAIYPAFNRHNQVRFRILLTNPRNEIIYQVLAREDFKLICHRYTVDRYPQYGL